MNTVAGRRQDLTSSLAMASCCDSGRKREHNEDRVHIDPANGLAIVADGMGGHNAGEVASQLAIDSLVEAVCHGLGNLAEGAQDGDLSAEGQLLRRAIEQSNRIIEQTARNQKMYEGMGTTVVATVFHDDSVSIGSVGDSRVYRLRGGTLEQLTQDHTLLQELVNRGFYTPEEARASLNRNIVTRALGVESDVGVDIIEDVVLKHDRYLLCSDGLNDMVEDRDIQKILGEPGDDLDRIARMLVDRANRNGGKDNISAAVIDVRNGFPVRRSWFQRVVDWFQ